MQGSTGGPDAEARAKGGSHIVGIAYDAAGRQLSEVHLRESTATRSPAGCSPGPRAACGRTGSLESALGPVDALGLGKLGVGCAEAGITEEGGPRDAQSTKPVTAAAELAALERTQVVTRGRTEAARGPLRPRSWRSSWAWASGRR